MVIDDDEAEALLDAILGSVTYTPSATVYLGLLTDDPAQDGTGYTEVTGTAYARVTKTNNTTNFPACVSGSRQKLNGTVITFPTAGASWGAVVGVGVFYASSGGDCKLYAPLPSPETINTGNVFSLAINALKFTALV